MTIRNFIRAFGLEALRGKKIKVGERTLYIHNDDLDAAIELWIDEPENAYRHQRFYGGETPTSNMVRWIYANDEVLDA